MAQLKKSAELVELNTPEQDVEAFRQLCLSERSNQLVFFNERFANKLGKEGVKEAEAISKHYDEKVGTKKELSVVSTEFSEFIKGYQIDFPSMKDRKEAFKDLDIDGNLHCSLIEFLIFVNKDMILKSSEERWGVAPPKSGADYTKAVLRELFLPATGYETSFDKALVTFVTNTNALLAKKAELEKSKEGLTGVQSRNIDQQIHVVEQDLIKERATFDRDLPKASKIGNKAKKQLEQLKAELAADEAEADKKPKVNKGQFSNK